MTTVTAGRDLQNQPKSPEVKGHHPDGPLRRHAWKRDMLLWTDSGKGLDIYRPTCPLTFLGPMSTCAESSPIVAFYLVGFGDGFGHGLEVSHAGIAKSQGSSLCARLMRGPNAPHMKADLRESVNDMASFRLFAIRFGGIANGKGGRK
ncbi:conserved hypothetical protein [Coccidioides posadasii str. Silveira]|uniref:Uncharacterized protein n=1 Tax=Coccidioides posadasii (strain RMSCC 757 / Silveira) TaxID=443226 RepID=E9D510_COCPS|nr:conserved hypothetical protein [Coccidioides posadasii str. Silveira]